jgi:hypothetical protein
MAISIYALAFSADKLPRKLPFRPLLSQQLQLCVCQRSSVALPHLRPTLLPKLRLSKRSPPSKAAESILRNGQLYFMEVRPFVAGRL